MARVFPQLLPELADTIVSGLDPNEVPSFRLINKAAAERYRAPNQTTFRLSRPVPPHAFATHWLAPGATRGLNFRRRRELVRLTAGSGVVANLEVALQAAGCPFLYEVFEAAAGAGQLASCQFLLELGFPTSDEGNRGSGLLAAAAGGGHRHVCEWLLGLGLAWSSDGAAAAARGGHLDLMEWLLERQVPLAAPAGGADGQLAQGVAHGCDLPTLQRMWRGGWGELSDRAKGCILAAAGGSPTPDWAAKVEWLEAQGCPRTDRVGAAATTRPDAPARLAWLRGRGYPLTQHTLWKAVWTGNEAALQYLLAEVRPESVAGEEAGEEAGEVAVCASLEGRLEALRALHAAGWPLLADRCASCAARNGHLHVVAWLVEALGAEASLWGPALLAAAAESGSVEVMAWLRGRGCEWAAGTVFASAAYSGCEAALEWLVERGCPVEDGGMALVLACRNGDLATVRLLRRLGVPWGRGGSLVREAAHGGPLSLLRWLLEAGCPVGDYESVRAAAELRTSGKEEALQLLDAHRRGAHGDVAAAAAQ
ncbi:hypothetical protein GPECTOR_47g302 [Gonium pectorale]|uniref:Uncharacterized protein n=1 Tax=Gonium pectorale TaxID=33097 RepID=A0A150G853_GONPE|nr:hypothetical protein GPECTOR_47g302 [Gonium pectorale]|eukprot:KXZ46027.1 hypothetical protein GPECTOR_47g302 [Gonium pectorale]